MEIELHYFKRNIGDYHKKAGRLSLLEHGAYTLLMDACYDREQFPSLEQAYDWSWARTEDEKLAVRFVLEKFFELEGGVYLQKRISEEIAKFHENSKTNARIAKEREARKRTVRATSVDGSFTNEHLTTNQEPLTINQEPKTKTSRVVVRPQSVSQQVWDDYKLSRKAPFTETVLKTIESEAKKAGWTIEAALKESILRGWRGFRADWVKDKQPRDQGRAGI